MVRSVLAFGYRPPASQQTPKRAYDHTRGTIRAMSKKTPDYGQDAPGIVRTCLFFGGSGLCVGGVLAWRAHHILLMWLGVAIALASAIPFVQGLRMIYYAKAGKFRYRDRILDFVNWKGQEAVLDVGTGRGLLWPRTALDWRGQKNYRPGCGHRPLEPGGLVQQHCGKTRWRTQF